MNRFPSLSDENLKIKHSLREFFSVHFLKLVQAGTWKLSYPRKSVMNSCFYPRKSVINCLFYPRKSVILQNNTIALWREIYTKNCYDGKMILIVSCQIFNVRICWARLDDKYSAILYISNWYDMIIFSLIEWWKFKN